MYPSVMCTSTLLWPSVACKLGPPLVGCGHKIVLRKDMPYEWTCLPGLHVFQDDMSYQSICLKGGHALWEKMFFGGS